MVNKIPTPAERLSLGKALRSKVARSVHGEWKAEANRPDPIALLEASSKPRLQHLVPIRYGRMLTNPFTYFRGAPVVMASDLSTNAVTGIRVQACGDAHLRNFGLYASPERNVLFDLNDFDETLPGPWEWDLKRLTTSFVVAGRCNGFKEAECADAAKNCARFYREWMRKYSDMHLLDVWYSKVDADAVLGVFNRTGRKQVAKDLEKARGRNSLQALSKLAKWENGKLQLQDSPPLVTHIKDEKLSQSLHVLFKRYLTTLQEDRQELLSRYHIVDFALKVVGVGSVGTRCYVVLLDSSHEQDPLLLQMKEARPSVLETHVGNSVHREHGRRVVAGQRLIQAASDIFLGWSNYGGHHYYFRMLRDMKGTADIESMTPQDFSDYAQLCGWVLARAHARSSDSAPIAGYLGKSDAFDEAITRFAVSYANQTEQDFALFTAAVKSGRLPAEKTD